MGRRTETEAARNGEEVTTGYNLDAVAMAFRVDLQPFLTEFVERHRGLRIGRMFGSPAGYAGRRLFVYLTTDGLIVKLPHPVAREEIRRGKASPFVYRGRPSRTWIEYSPQSMTEMNRLVPLLEVAARHVAQTT